jgi:hypothetical protein
MHEGLPGILEQAPGVPAPHPKRQVRRVIEEFIIRRMRSHASILDLIHGIVKKP